MGRDRERPTARDRSGRITWRCAMSHDRLRCAGCNWRFGKRAESVLLFAACVLCERCADEPDVHRRLWFTCPETHSPRHHDNAIVSMGRARQALLT